MKNRNQVIFFLLFVSASCSNQSNIKEVNSALKEYVKTIPPYASFINTPEDTLLLGFNKGTTNEDTSWTLLVSKSKDIIQCRYNQLLPYTVTGFNDYLDESTKLIYYEGFSFEIDSKQWYNIIGLLSLDKYMVKDSVPYTGCLHCPRYTAYYKSKIIVNSKQDNEYLVNLDSILHKELISKLLEKKRNPPIQLQK